MSYLIKIKKKWIECSNSPIKSTKGLQIVAEELKLACKNWWATQGFNRLYSIMSKESNFSKYIDLIIF